MPQRERNILGVINSYGKQLLGFIRSKVTSDEDAEDILQDIWYQVSTHEELDAIESMSGWLYRVSKNKIADRFKKKKSDSLEDYSFFSDDGELHFKEILLADSHTPEDEYQKDLFWEVLYMALDELPENQRLVFVQNELDDKTLQQIALEENVPLKTIISRKGYAVKHLRQRLNEFYSELGK